MLLKDKTSTRQSSLGEQMIKLQQLENCWRIRQVGNLPIVSYMARTSRGFLNSRYNTLMQLNIRLYQAALLADTSI